MSSAPAPELEAPDVEALLQQAKRLPREQQLRLAEELLDGSVEPDEGVEQAWHQELRRRLQALDDGTAVLLDGEQHVQRLRDKFGV